MDLQQDYLQAFRGSFTSALRWHHLDALWQVLRDDAGGYFDPAVVAAAEQSLPRMLEVYDRLKHV